MLQNPVWSHQQRIFCAWMGEVYNPIYRQLFSAFHILRFSRIHFQRLDILRESAISTSYWSLTFLLCRCETGWTSANNCNALDGPRGELSHVQEKFNVGLSELVDLVFLETQDIARIWRFRATEIDGKNLCTNVCVCVYDG